MTAPPVAEEPRQCGACALCCKLYEIPALQKAQGAWCQHCSTHKACDVYDVRPEVCERFECLWKEGYLPDEFYPARAHFAITYTKNGKGLQVHVDPDYEGAASRRWVRRYFDLVLEQHPEIPILIVRGNHRTRYINSRTVTLTPTDPPIVLTDEEPTP